MCELDSFEWMKDTWMWVWVIEWMKTRPICVFMFAISVVNVFSLPCMKHKNELYCIWSFWDVTNPWISCCPSSSKWRRARCSCCSRTWSIFWKAQSSPNRITKTKSVRGRDDGWERRERQSERGRDRAREGGTDRGREEERKEKY